MKAVLKGLFSPDIDDLERFQPEQSENFCFLLQAFIGPEGEQGEESFDIEVCTPKWLELNIDMDGVLIGRHHLIVRKYSYENIRSAIEKFLISCSGNNWNEIADKVSRLGFWEFEDYQE